MYKKEWQQELDEAFPKGAVFLQSEGYEFPTPRPIVTEVSGEGVPRILVWNPESTIIWNETARKAIHSTGEDNELELASGTLSSRVSPDLAEALAEHRNDIDPETWQPS